MRLLAAFCESQSDKSHHFCVTHRTRNIWSFSTVCVIATPLWLSLFFQRHTPCRHGFRQPKKSGQQPDAVRHQSWCTQGSKWCALSHNARQPSVLIIWDSCDEFDRDGIEGPHLVAIALLTTPLTMTGSRSHERRSMGRVGLTHARDRSGHTQLVSSSLCLVQPLLWPYQSTIERDYAHDLQKIHRQDRRRMETDI